MKLFESDLQRQVQDYLTSRGVRHFHFPRGVARKRRQLKDIPDLICLGFGRVFFIELKRPGTRAVIRPGQKEFKALCDYNKIPCLISRKMKEIVDFIDLMAVGK